MENKLRLCFLTPRYPTRHPVGGIAACMQDGARWLAEKGHDISVVCVTRTGPWGDEIDKGVKVFFVPPFRIKPRRLLHWGSKLLGLAALEEAYAGWNLLENSCGACRAVRKLSSSRPFDLVIYPDFGAIAFCGLLNISRRTPIMLLGHGFLDLDQPYIRWPGARFQHWLEYFCLSRSDFVLTNSNYLLGQYIYRFHVNPERIGHLPIGFSLPSEEPSGKKLKIEKDWDDNTIVVLYVGRLEYQKGCDTLFRSLEQAHNHCPQIRAVLLGDVSENFRTEYESFFDVAHDWIWHPGAVSLPEVMSWMECSDMLVLPSRSETFGRVVVEAQLRGLAPIASNVGALPEIIENGVTGLLVPVDDTASLTEGILTLCSSKELRIRIGKNARERALEKFELSNVMVEQVQIYRTIIEAHSTHKRLLINGDR